MTDLIISHLRVLEVIIRLRKQLSALLLQFQICKNDFFLCIPQNKSIITLIAITHQKVRRLSTCNRKIACHLFLLRIVVSYLLFVTPYQGNTV